MHVLRIEHEVPDYDRWKNAFDSDPIGRQAAGVLRYRVLRGAADPNFVMIDLEFETAAEAERMETSLRELWGRVDVARNPQARQAELVESQDVKGL
jgi:hypothetical protein